MRKISFYILFILAFVACSNDDSDSKWDVPVYDNTMFVGEWVSVNQSKTLYSNLILLNSTRCDFILYQNQTGEKSVFKEDHGSWSWYQNRQLLGFSLGSNHAPYHQIVELSSGKMLLRNIENNTTDEYYRVVEVVDVEAGQSSAIQSLKNLSGLSLSSSNEVVATVSEDGVVSGLQGGTAFISVEGGETTCYVKVRVNSRVDRFASETHLSIGEVIEKYGDPDLTGSLGGVKAGILYNVSNPDSELTLVQYDYDILTNEVILIHTAYKSEETFSADIDYMDEHFYLQDSSTGFLFGKKEIYWDNEFIVTPFVSNGIMYVNYQNQDYSQF